MKLTKYSASPLAFDPDWKYDQDDRRGPYGKPRGFWVSDDSDHGWRAWCEAEEWNLEGLSFKSEFMLAPGHNVLILRGVDELKTFDAEYGMPLEVSPTMRTIDWPRVAAEYDGIIITPYLWEARYDFDVFWYAGWDCASGCIWNLSAIVPYDYATDKSTGASDWTGPPCVGCGGTGIAVFHPAPPQEVYEHTCPACNGHGNDPF